MLCLHPQGCLRRGVRAEVRCCPDPGSTRASPHSCRAHLFLLNGAKGIGEEGKGLPRRVDCQGWPGETSLSFRIDWLGLLAIQGTLMSLLQHHSLKASILQHSVFFMVQLSHPYMTSGKTIALTVDISVSKVMSRLYNTLSRFVIAFLPRNKHLLISQTRLKRLSSSSNRKLT